MKRLVALVVVFAFLLLLVGCQETEIQSTETSRDNVSNQVSGSQLLIEGNVIKCDVSSLPEYYNYSFKGESAKKIVGYLSSLNLESNFEENPNYYGGMTWKITLEYDNGEILNVYHFGDFIRTENSSWYKMTYEQASYFDELLDEIKNTSSSPLSVTELIDGFEEENTFYIYANDRKTILSMFDNGKWINDAPNCGHDFVFNYNGNIYRYHSECGTFYSMTDKQGLELSEIDRDKVNDILSSLFN